MDPDRRCQEELLEAEAEASTRATEECGAQPGKGPVLPELEARRIGREICGSTIRIFNNNNNNNNNHNNNIYIEREKIFWVLHTPSLGCRAVPSGVLNSAKPKPGLTPSFWIDRRQETMPSISPKRSFTWKPVGT